MNQFQHENKKQKKNAKFSCHLFNITKSPEKVFPPNDIKSEIKKSKINRNILDNDLSIDDIYKENDSFFVSQVPNQLDLSYFEINNISSMNSTNEYKFFEYFDYFQPILKQEDNKIQKQKIFEITKINKKIGRIKKNSTLIGKHNKFSQDNIIRKIKRRFLENVRLYINDEYKKDCISKKKNKGKNNWLKKIDPKFSRKIKKRDNLQWFKFKIFEVFSENISLKYTSFGIDSNKQKIQNFFLTEEPNKVKDILNTTIETLFNIYIKNEKLDNFKTLNDDVKQLEKQMKELGQENIKEYLIKYEKTAKNMKMIFINKTERNNEGY
jgi:hypothetical protein